MDKFKTWFWNNIGYDTVSFLAKRKWFYERVDCGTIVRKDNYVKHEGGKYCAYCYGWMIANDQVDISGLLMSPCIGNKLIKVVKETKIVFGNLSHTFKLVNKKL